VYVLLVLHCPACSRRALAAAEQLSMRRAAMVENMKAAQRAHVCAGS